MKYDEPVLPDRVKCVVCGNYRGSHDGLPPHKMMNGVCPAFVAPASPRAERGEA